MEINDLIFKEMIKRGCRLEGKTRVWDLTDSKLWYLTPPQAQGFLDLEKSQAYKKDIIQKEISLIKGNLRDIVKHLPKDSYNLIDLGCGDGKKAALFIKELGRLIKIRYCPIDISSYMVGKASNTIRSMNVGDVIEFRYNISDFENLENVTPLLRDRSFSTNLLLLLGNTMGNFDKDDIIHGIKKGMKKGDFLLVGNGINSTKKTDILKAYRQNLVNEWLVKVIEQVGLSSKDVSYGVRFRNSRIEIFYTTNKDKEVKHLGKRAEFRKGDMIIAAISYKYSRTEFRRILMKFFRNVIVYTYPEETYALALCRR